MPVEHLRFCDRRCDRSLSVSKGVRFYAERAVRKLTGRTVDACTGGIMTPVGHFFPEAPRKTARAGKVMVAIDYPKEGGMICF